MSKSKTAKITLPSNVAKSIASMIVTAAKHKDEPDSLKRVHIVAKDGELSCIASDRYMIIEKTYKVPGMKTPHLEFSMNHELANFIKKIKTNDPIEFKLSIGEPNDKGVSICSNIITKTSDTKVKHSSSTSPYPLIRLLIEKWKPAKTANDLYLDYSIGNRILKLVDEQGNKVSYWLTKQGDDNQHKDIGSFRLTAAGFNVIWQAQKINSKYKASPTNNKDKRNISF